MSNDSYERIRQAMAMKQTPGPWEVVNMTGVFTPLGARNAAGVEAAADDGWYIADCDMGPSFTEEGKENIPYVEKQANAALIAACDPDTIRALLAERDALLDALRRITEWPDGGNRYGQENIKRFAQHAIDDMPQCAGGGQ